jgi:hypothetical protein
LQSAASTAGDAGWASFAKVRRRHIANLPPLAVFCFIFRDKTDAADYRDFGPVMARGG